MTFLWSRGKVTLKTHQTHAATSARNTVPRP
jgi:hypothetical protein